MSRAAAGGPSAGPAGLSSDAAIAGGQQAAKAALSAPAGGRGMTGTEELRRACFAIAYRMSWVVFAAVA